MVYKWFSTSNLLLIPPDCALTVAAMPRKLRLALEIRASKEGFMDLIVPTQPAASVRAWKALRSRGVEYAWHKLLRRTLRDWPTWKRRFLYADPCKYWTLRGGDDYFREQEGQQARSLRAEWIAGRLATYRPASILEVGCGYGKLLHALRHRLDVPLVGVDFSPTQLNQARSFLRNDENIELLLSRGERLPFADRSFDIVVTSAVILHNPPAVAERIRAEVIRVSRRFAAHNEETNLSYNRYGYDTALWYRQQGIVLAELGPIPMDPDPSASQFCVAVVYPGEC
jgi:SAM-dependent methyltransferase